LPRLLFSSAATGHSPSDRTSHSKVPHLVTPTFSSPPPLRSSFRCCGVCASFPTGVAAVVLPHLELTVQSNSNLSVNCLKAQSNFFRACLIILTSPSFSPSSRLNFSPPYVFRHHHPPNPHPRGLSRWGVLGKELLKKRSARPDLSFSPKLVYALRTD